MDLKQFNPMKILNHWGVINAIVNGENPKPISCEIDPSNLCNHDCIWCMYGEFKKRENKIIPKDILFNLIADLKRGGVKSITFTGGGDPLTNPATVEALRRVKKYGMGAGLVTNGGLLNREIGKIIIDTCDFLRISLDAATSITHKRVHNPKDISKDNFDKIICNLRDINDLRKKRKSNITLGLAFLVHPLNYFEIYKAVKIAKEIGMDYIQIRPVYIPGKTLSKRIWIKTCKFMEQSLELVDNKFYVFPILHRFDEMTRLERSYKRCLAHSLLGVVGADCSLYLCCQLRGAHDYNFGNLKEKSFWDIWYSQRRQEVINQINLSKCPPCRYHKYNELLDYLADKERPHKDFL